jgi:ABC-2 type transport system permease protein
VTSFRSIWLVALRESTERARSRSYIVSTALTLVIVGVLVGIMVLTSRQTPTYDIGVTGTNPPSLPDTIAATATATDSLVSVIEYPDEASVRSAVDDGTIDAAVIDDDVIVVRQSGGSGVEPIVEAALRQARFLTALTEAGIDPATLIDNRSIAIESTEPPDDDGDEAVAVIAIVLLFLVITTYGQWVLLGVLEEKSTRVVEQLVSSTSVRSLLAGKVIGVGLLGFAQLAVLIAAGVAVGSAFDAFDLPSSTYATAAWSAVWFVLGFAFYAVMYAAAGSLVSRSEDAQTAATPVALLGVAAYLVTFGLVLGGEPDSVVARIISILPPVAPIAYPARIAAGAVPLWENLLAVAVTLAAVVGVVRIAARIYAGALLAQGSRIKLRQAWRASKELVGR